jgi:hypothetical protein
MRLAVTGLLAVALPAMLAACAPAPIDPEQATERAATGAVLGAALGAGLGATVAIDPGLGAIIGTESGGAIGAAIGIATTPPIPSYRPVVLPAEAVIPNFYDNWPPSYHSPPGNPETQPPHAG